MCFSFISCHSFIPCFFCIHCCFWFFPYFSIVVCFHLTAMMVCLCECVWVIIRYNISTNTILGMRFFIRMVRLYEPKIALQKWMAVQFLWFSVICCRKISIIHLFSRFRLLSDLPLNFLLIGTRNTFSKINVHINWYYIIYHYIIK